MADALEAFTQASMTAPPETIYGHLQALIDALVGVRLFTCSRFDLATGTAERIHSSDPQAYPVTGRKAIVANRWTEIVLDRRRPFLATHVDEIRDVFPDHAQIEALGLGSVINLPVWVSGRFLGTVNLLHRNGQYGADTLPRLAPTRLPCAIAMLVADRSRAPH